MIDIDKALQEYVDDPANRLNQSHKDLVLKKISQGQKVPEPVVLEEQRGINPLIYVAALAVCVLVLEVIHGF